MKPGVIKPRPYPAIVGARLDHAHACLSLEFSRER